MNEHVDLPTDAEADAALRALDVAQGDTASPTVLTVRCGACARASRHALGHVIAHRAYGLIWRADGHREVQKRAGVRMRRRVASVAFLDRPDLVADAGITWAPEELACGIVANCPHHGDELLTAAQLIDAVRAGRNRLLIHEDRTPL